jgi:hypothetical protein
VQIALECSPDGRRSLFFHTESPPYDICWGAPPNQNHIAFFVQLFEPFKFCPNSGITLYACFQKISIFPHDFFSVTVSSDDKGIVDRDRPAYVSDRAIAISSIANSYA